MNNDFGYIVNSYVRSLENGLRIIDTGNYKNLNMATQRVVNILDARDEKRSKMSFSLNRSDNHSGPVWSSVKFAFRQIDMGRYFSLFTDSSNANPNDEYLCYYGPGKFIIVDIISREGGFRTDTFVLKADTSEYITINLYDNKRYFNSGDKIDTYSGDIEQGVFTRDSFAYTSVFHTGLIVRSLIYYVGLMDRDLLWDRTVYNHYGSNFRDTILDIIERAIDFHEHQWNSAENLYIINTINPSIIPRIGYYFRDRQYSTLPWNMNFTMGHAVSRLHLFGLNKCFSGKSWINRDREMMYTFINNNQRSGLRLKENYYVWKYHSEIGDNTLEDIIHGNYDVDFINTFYLAERDQKMISGRDMQYFANTLIHCFFDSNIRYSDFDRNCRTYDCYNFMNKENRNRISRNSVHGARWSYLTHIDPRVYEIAFNLFTYKDSTLFSYIEKYRRNWVPADIEIVVSDNGSIKYRISNIRTLGYIKLILIQKSW